MSPLPFQPIAITGLSALFPQARSVDEFWRLILSGRDCMQEIPATHWLVDDYYDADPKAPGKTYSKAGAFLKDVPFDPVAYGLPPNVLPATDIAQLLALLLARQVLEDCSGGQIAKLKLDTTSVILGVASATEMISSMSGLLTQPMWIEGMRSAGIAEPQVQEAVKRITALFPEWNENTFPGCLGNVVAGRVANRFNLGGTNCVTDAACASSLAALHMGIGELQLHSADRVITGGVDALNTIFMYMCFSKTPAMSPTGHCRPFADNADGTMMGEGGGMLVLRRLADAERDGDQIYAVIRGLGSSSDGRSKSVYAPRPEGQTLSLQRCYALAGYSPETVRLVEAHGTATAAGDLCEATALKEVFSAANPERRQWCALGSVKSQIGHTKGAAGSAGLVKVALALRHQVYPPTANVDAPNPELGFADSPLYLSTKARPWIQAKAEARRGSVSSFGFGGTNFHVAVEEYRGKAAAPRVRAFNAEVWLASAASAAELADCVAAWRKAGEADFERGARRSQQAFDAAALCRAAIVAKSAEDLVAKSAKLLERLQSQKPGTQPAIDGVSYALAARPAGAAGVVFLFPGQGSQSVGMAAELPMHFEAAMEVWEQQESLGLLGAERLCDLVYPPPAVDTAEAARQEQQLRSTENAQPALGTVSLAYLAVLAAAGVQPELVGGHSFGEIVALHAAGVLERDDCLRLSRKRGELMAEVSRVHPGAMTAVVHPAEKLAALLTGELAACVIANYNSPQQSVVAGPLLVLERLEALLAKEKIVFRRLPVATAFHSVAVSPACEPLQKFLGGIKFGKPRLPVYNNTSAAPYAGDAQAMRGMLAAQLAQPVQFAQQLQHMQAAGGRIFIEVGAGAVLSGLVRQTLGDAATVIALNPAGQAADVGLLAGLARLAVAGVAVNWDLLWDGYRALAPEPKLSAAALPVGGYNIGRPYPPRSGVKTAPVLENAPARQLTQASAAVAAPAGAARMPAAPQAAPQPAASVAPAAPQPAPTVRPAAGSDAVARAHETFMRTMSEAHRAFLETVGSARLAAPAAAAAQPQQAAPPALQARAMAAPPAAPAVARAPQAAPVVAAQVIAAVPPVAAPASAAHSSAFDSARVIEIVLQTVADKTGYPREMLEPPMLLEADLGIDSIKRVEILSAVQKQLPGLPPVDAKVMGGLQTLAAISAYLLAALGVQAPAVALNGTAAHAAPAAAVAGVVFAAAAVMPIVLQTVADKTGYPVEMLEPGMLLEADLGIDSIKRVEILSAVQKLLPGLPPVDAKVMGGLQTLQAISDYLTQQLSGAAAPVAAAPVGAGTRAAAAAAAPAAALPVLRYQLRAVPAAAPGFALAGLQRAQHLFITDDGRGIGAALAAALRAQGIAATVGSSVPAACDALILLDGLGAAADVDAACAAQRAAFSAARAAASALQAAGGVFVTVQDTGGSYGLGSAALPRAWYGGFAGLAKSAAKEWPTVAVRSIDLECGKLPAQQLGQRLADELLNGGDERETGLAANGTRVRLALNECAPAAAARGRIPAKTVVVATGGARGVTAAALLALARAQQPIIALLGRTQLLPEPAQCAGVVEEGALRQALLTAEKNAGRQLAPKALAAAVSDILARREILATLAQLRAAGSTVEYWACDASDAASVQAVLAQVRKQLGPIRVLVHGAGVLADKLIAEKSDEQFARVFDTKVRGLQVLLAATAKDELDALLLFSSVAGRFGNVGQADYAMANETLNKVAQAEFVRRGGKCLVRSINWGPWEGGMVTPALRAHFAEQGIGLIAHAAGAAAFVAELGGGATAADVEVVIGAGRLDLAAADPALPEHRVEIVVSAQRYPFLRDHVVRGKVVVPLALVVEWFCRAAALARPAATLHALRDVAVMKAILIGDAEREQALLAVTTRTRDAHTLELRIVDAASGKPHFTALADFSKGETKLLNGAVRKDAGWREFGFAPAAAYEGRLFHGRELQVISKLGGWSAAAATLELANKPLAGGDATAWHVGPALLDGALQAAALWTLQAYGKSSLPLRIAELVLTRAARKGEKVSCQLAGYEQAGAGTVSDIDCVDAKGAPICMLRGVECFQVDSY